MKTYILSIFFLLAAMVALPSATWASDSPMKLLQDTQKKVEKILDTPIDHKDKAATQQREQEIQNIVEPFFDFDMLARQTLNQHWSGLKTEEQKAFTFWFKDLLKQAYIGGVRDQNNTKENRQKAQINYLKEQVQATKATVQTEIKYQVKKKDRVRWKRVRMDWMFVKVTGQWKVSDIVTNDTSLIETYQENFDKIIRKEAFAGLLKKIRDKVNELREKHGLSALNYPKS